MIRNMTLFVCTNTYRGIKMSETYCGTNCSDCAYDGKCKGCKETCGSPFGGRCPAAEYIKIGGMENYLEFKAKLKIEVNELLAANGIGPAEELFELNGEYVNLAYPLPSGDEVKFLNDKNVYLGAQIEFGDQGVCYGVVADQSFILICSYSVNGSEPELIAYRKR